MMMLLVAMGAKHPGVFEGHDFLLKLLRSSYLRKICSLVILHRGMHGVYLMMRKQSSRLEV